MTPRSRSRPDAHFGQVVTCPNPPRPATTLLCVSNACIERPHCFHAHVMWKRHDGCPSDGLHPASPLPFTYPLPYAAPRPLLLQQPAAPRPAAPFGSAPSPSRRCSRPTARVELGPSPPLGPPTRAPSPHSHRPRPGPSTDRDRPGCAGEYISCAELEEEKSFIFFLLKQRSSCTSQRRVPWTLETYPPF